MSRRQQAPVSHAHQSLTHSRLLTLPGARRAFGAAAAGGIGVAALAPDLALAGVALALTGTVLAPSAVLSYLSAERLAGPGAEASTWVNTAWNAGLAAGLALSGLALSRAGTTTPLLAGAAVLACAALAVLRRRSVFDAPSADAPSSDARSDASSAAVERDQR